MRTSFSHVLPVLWLLGCPPTRPTGTGDPADTDTDSDTDSDADTDSDTDTDVPVDCAFGAYPTPAPGLRGLPSCVTEEVSCGDVIYATNHGGSTVYGTEEGEVLWMCSGAAEHDDFAGPERVYKLQAPEEYRGVSVRIQSCEPTRLIWHWDARACPTEPLFTCGYPISDDLTRTDQSDSLLFTPSHLTYFVVEGFGNLGGNFILTLDCFH